MFGLKSNTMDAYEYFQILNNKDANFSGIYNKKLMRKLQTSQWLSNAHDRAKIYREIKNEIEEMCIIRPLITIPMRVVFVKKNLKTPYIGIGPLNEYYLGNISSS